MKSLKHLKLCIAAAMILALAACTAAEKEEPLYYEDGIVNLNGPWGEDTPFELSATEKDISSEMVAKMP